MNVGVIKLFVDISTAFVDLRRFFSFFIYAQSVGLLGRGISPSAGRYLHTEQHKQGINAQNVYASSEFKSTISVFGWAKTVYVFNREATMMSSYV
jgi:hypothetical protein